jgi:hypothetical protein
VRLGPLLARKSETTSSAAPEAASGQAGRVRYRHWWWLPGWLFAAVTTLPALLAIAWLVPGIALLLGGRLIAVPILIMFPAITIALGYFVLRQLPVSWPKFRDETPKRVEPASRRPDVPLDVLVLVVAVAVGYLIWQLSMTSQNVIVTGDAGAYLQYAIWIAGHGSAHISQSAAAFGGPQSGMNFASYGFYQTGSTISPAFLPGLPIVLAAGVWAHAASGALVFGPVLGACAILAFAGLAGRLAGPRWAPAAALLLAVELPEQYVSRASFSEPLVQILLYGGLCMIIDSMVMPSRRHGPSQIRGMAVTWQVRVLACCGGLALGLSALVSASALDYLIPVLLFLGILAVGRRPQALPLLVGVVVGAAISVIADSVLARQYIRSLSLRPLGTAFLVILGVSALIAIVLQVPQVRRFLRSAFSFRVPVIRRWKLPSLSTVLPWIAGALPVIALGLLLARPYIQTVHSTANATVAAIQHAEGYRPDGTRTYAEDSLYWVIWYLGLPALLMGVAGLSMLTWRCVRALVRWRGRDLGGPARVWGLPLLIFGWGILTVLWDPSIVPSQPDAARRLVPVVLPGLVVAGLWVSSRLMVHARILGAGHIAAGAVATCCVLAMGVPAVWTAYNGAALKHVDDGELTAVRGVCQAIGSDASVIIVSPTTGSSWAQVIRGMCSEPVVQASGGVVTSLISGAERAGRHPVVLGSSAASLSSYGGTPREILSLETSSLTPSLIRPPQGVSTTRYTLWLWAPDGQSISPTSA